MSHGNRHKKKRNSSSYVPRNNNMKKNSKSVQLNIVEKDDSSKACNVIEDKNETYKNLDSDIKIIKKKFKEEYIKEKQIEIRIKDFYIANNISQSELFKRKKHLFKKIKNYEMVLLPFVMSVFFAVFSYFNPVEYIQGIYNDIVVTFRDNILKADEEMTNIIERNKNIESIHNKQVNLYNDAMKDAKKTLNYLVIIVVNIATLVVVASLLSFLFVYQICGLICRFQVNESQTIDFELALIEERLDLPINKHISIRR